MGKHLPPQLRLGREPTERPKPLRPPPKAPARVTEYTPGQVMVLKTEATEPVRYKFSKQVTYVTSDGRVIQPSRIRKDSKVHVHYVKDGDDMLVDKVIVTKDRE
jgi:hypothetical protein